jgi:cytochrome c-type biogenesis protein CcmE
MAQTTWEKSASAAPARGARTERLKFMIGGVLLLGAIGYLVFSGTLLGARFFITVDEVVQDPQYLGKPVRISGVVLGNTITVNEENSEQTVITFTVANYDQNHPNLAEALHLGAEDAQATRLNIRVVGQPKPELLRHEAQAIMTGTLLPDGTFVADELNFKCPSRFENSAPVMGEQEHPGLVGNVS